MTLTVTEPSDSSASSSDVATVSVAVPTVPTVTVCGPVETPKSPLWATVTSTDSDCAGAGLADTVNTASPPSVTPPPEVTLISGGAGTASVTVKRIGTFVVPAPLSVTVSSNSYTPSPLASAGAW
ncbi:MAG: hypothetical protein F4015_10080 [Acidimicrobiia bacterium]|nr:hypothetical protein [Acidimicrobiia bacterium]